MPGTKKPSQASLASEVIHLKGKSSTTIFTDLHKIPNCIPECILMPTDKCSFRPSLRRLRFAAETILEKM